MSRSSFLRSARKAWHVFVYEYRRHVLRRGFLGVVFGFPLLMGLVVGGVVWYFESQGDDPVGVVNETGLTLPAADRYAAFDIDSVPFVIYPDEAAARAALADETIQAFLVLPATYLETGQAELYFEESPYEGLSSDIRAYLRAAWLADADPAVTRRFVEGPYELRFHSLQPDGGGNEFLEFLLPYITSLVFYVGIFTTAGYLLQAVVDEKENRTMEILITSVSPEQLMLGKVFGLIAVGLTQITIWLGAAFFGIGQLLRSVPSLVDLSVPYSSLVIIFLWFLPYYIIVAALIAAVGVTVTNVAEGQQAIGILNLLSLAPLMLMFIIVTNPDSVMAVALSLFPFTAPITILTRWQATDIPIWQLATSWLLLALFTAGSLMAVSRLLRVGMLRYGQKLSLREMGRALRRGGVR